ncbi:MAG: host attachment protein [Pseudomonadota bacterium]
MKKLKKNCRVLIADGAKALIFENTGDASQPHLELLQSFDSPNPPSRELGEARGGRVYSSAGTNRSAMEVTDFHEMAEEAFIRELAQMLEADRAKSAFTSLIIAAPPKALSYWRAYQTDKLEAITIAQIAKDYTKNPSSELVALLVKELERE